MFLINYFFIKNKRLQMNSQIFSRNLKIYQLDEQKCI